jgi:hypothetical protein
MIAAFAGASIAPIEGAQLGVFRMHHRYRKGQQPMKNARFRGRFQGYWRP